MQAYMASDDHATMCHAAQRMDSSQPALPLAVVNARGSSARRNNSTDRNSNTSHRSSFANERDGEPLKSPTQAKQRLKSMSKAAGQLHVERWPHQPT